MKEFAQGISFSKEQTVTLDRVTLEVSSALLTLIHTGETMHAGTNKEQTVKPAAKVTVLVTDLVVLLCLQKLVYYTLLPGLTVFSFHRSDTVWFLVFL